MYIFLYVRLDLCEKKGCKDARTIPTHMCVAHVCCTGKHAHAYIHMCGGFEGFRFEGFRCQVLEGLKGLAGREGKPLVAVVGFFGILRFGSRVASLVVFLTLDSTAPTRNSRHEIPSPPKTSPAWKQEGQTKRPEEAKGKKSEDAEHEKQGEGKECEYAEHESQEGRQ